MSDATRVPPILNVVLTVGVCAGAVAVIVLSDRAMTRFWNANHLLKGPKARVRQMKLTYDDRREGATEIAQIIAEVLASGA